MNAELLSKVEKQVASLRMLAEEIERLELITSLNLDDVKIKAEYRFQGSWLGFGEMIEGKLIRFLFDELLQANYSKLKELKTKYANAQVSVTE